MSSTVRPQRPSRPAARAATPPPGRAHATPQGACCTGSPCTRLAIAAALFFVLPFVFVFLTSVMSDQQALTGDLWPRSWHWSNYVDVLADARLPHLVAQHR